jgi:hypothetical protein
MAAGPNTSGAPLGLIVGDVRIEIASGFDEVTLRRLVQMLREPASC